ncbi:AraC family transcriptional regulator [Kitasatospora sp. NE20-6]|uniref:helix-turn-helix transcriptional regulator n=1 Tax=Kitasatospora sp. NE20-6 TaxID=2859066 RepID=UPI0034DBC477
MDGTSVVDESAGGRPAGPMAGHAAWYTGYRQAGLVPGRHRGLPSPFLTLIFTLDDPLTVSVHPEPGRGPAQYDALVGGLHTAPAVITHPGRQSGVQVGLDPLAARALLGVPAGELAGLDLPAEALLGPVAAEVRERMLAAADWPARFAVLDDVLPRAARPCGAPPPEVRETWRLLRASRGRVPVSALAAEVGWSERHLAARFRAETGLSPKAAARVVRFDRARRLAAAGGGRLADLAAACGYFDQAHLAREFRALAGVAPSVWRAEEFRNVQAAPVPAGAV